VGEVHGRETVASMPQSEGRPVRVHAWTLTATATAPEPSYLCQPDDRIVSS
jgi:hypothetical protein